MFNDLDGLPLGGWLFVGGTIVLSLYDNIAIILWISQSTIIKNQNKVLKILWSTVWMSMLTTFFWPFLIKWENDPKDSLSSLEVNKSKVNLLLYWCKILFFVSLLIFIGITYVATISDENITFYIGISILSLLVLADFIVNVIIIQKIKKNDDIKNKKKVIKILWSTIWMSMLTTFFWPFLIRWDKNEIQKINKSKDKNFEITKSEIKIKSLIHVYKLLFFLLLIILIGYLLIRLLFFDDNVSLHVIIAMIIILIVSDFIVNVIIIQKIKKNDDIKNKKKVIKILWSTIWMLNFTTLFWSSLIKENKNNNTNTKEL